MKRILIVGGTGFLGFHLAKYAIKKNFKVYCISKNPPSEKRFIKNITYLNFDLRKKKGLFIKDEIDYVINCAGYGKHLTYSQSKKKIFLDHINILKNLINLIDNKNIKKFINIGTSLEYSKNFKKIKETDKCNPTSYYGKAKLECTKYLINIYKKFNFPVVIFRVFQIYGPHQDKNRLIPHVIDKCKKNMKFNLTSGNQIRNFCYVDDFAEVVFKSLNKRGINGKIFNIGHPKSHNIKFIVKLIKNLIGKGYPIFKKKKMQIGETKFIVPNISNIKKFLNWTPKIDIKEGLKKII